jgi:hypothetical protein
MGRNFPRLSGQACTYVVACKPCPSFSFQVPIGYYKPQTANLRNINMNSRKKGRSEGVGRGKLKFSVGFMLCN